MNGGIDSERGDGEGQPVSTQVPIGWQRKVDSTGVIYFSPSGSVLSSLEQVKSYLLTDGTCKCGLECPLILPKVFNFDPGAIVKQRTAEDVKADEDVTKLCIHKRKLIAVATLHKSMELPHPSLTLTGPSGGTSSVVTMDSTIQRSSTPRAIRNKSHDGMPNSTLPDCKNPFKMMMATGPRHYSADMSSAQHPEHYSAYSRQRLSSNEPGPKSPYRGGPGGMLSPSSSLQAYGDGPLSPRTDSLGSPDGFARNNPCGFQGTGSPSPIHGNNRTPMSPPGIMIHGSPATQLSCAMAGRTNTPLSPPVPNKSPIMKKTHCNVSYPSTMDMTRAVFHHKVQSAPLPVPSPVMPPTCAVQKKQMTSEKDPLGILDPIPSKPVIQSPVTNSTLSNFQPNAHSQVPMMNVNIPPAIVPLPSNLPLPTVKPGPVGHGGHSGHMQRPQHGATTSISPSPVTSPVHMSGPVMGRMEASPQRSRSSSTSSEHGSFAMPSGPQVPCGSIKVPPRSPRSSIGSPRPTMPSSPSSKSDTHHQYKDPNQVLSGMSNAINSQHNTIFPPASGNSAPQKTHPGLLGMPLNQILNQHNSASFPASSLLSAAAKAQLANQNKLSSSSSGIGGSGAGMGVGTGIGAGTSGIGSGNAGLTSGSNGNGGTGMPCPLSGGGISSKGAEGPNTLNSMLPPSSTMLMALPEGQSGRAALRDKLMAQQRDPLRKRKQLPNASSHDNMGFNMMKPDMSGSRPTCPPPEQMRKIPRLGGLPPNTSMAQILQSMSNQSSHMVRGSRPLPAIVPSQIHFVEGAMPPGMAQQSMQLQQRLHSQSDPVHCPTIEPGSQGPQTLFPGMMNQMQATAIGNSGPLGQSGQVPLGHLSMGHPNTHPQHVHQQQQGIPHGHNRPNMTCMVPNSNDAQAMSDTGNTSSLNCRIGNPQMVRITSSTGHVYQQHQLHPALQSMHRVSPYQTQGHAYSETQFPENKASNNMGCLYQDYQGCMSDGTPISHNQISSQPGVTSLPAKPGMFQEGQQELRGQNEVTLAAGPGGQGVEQLPGAGTELVDALYRTSVDTASKGIQRAISTSTTGSSGTQASPVPALRAMTAFTASIGEPHGLPHAVNAVIHGPRGHENTDVLVQSCGRPPLPTRNDCARRTSEQGKCTPDSTDTHDYFRSPRQQWEDPGHAHWGGDEFLECSAQVRSSPCSDGGERATSGTDTKPQCHESSEPAADSNPGNFRYNQLPLHVNFKERLEQTVERCAHMNGGPPLCVRGSYNEQLTGDDQSPSSSTSLEGPLLKDYAHYNGHFNGHCAPSPSDTKSLSSEEELRHPDSPSAELLHYRPRDFNVGELVWPIKGFPPWPNKLVGEEHGHNPSMQLSDQAKVEPEKLKTLTQDLEALNRAAKRNRIAGKLNNHLEAAIQEAMSELDKMSGTVHPMSSRERERQMKLPKPKRRKISR